MITLLLIYLVGVVFHKYGVWWQSDKQFEMVLDYPDVKDMNPIFTIISILWPLFWVVFLFMFIRDFLKKMISKINL